MRFTTRRNVVSGLGLSGVLGLAGIRPAAADVVTIDQFKELIDGILATKGSLIAAGATVENGWEKWLQKAIIDTLAEKHITYDLAPEQHVYDNRDATADFVGNGPTKDNPNVAVTDKTFVVELKCQGRNASLFKAGLEIDCNKLRKREMNAAYQSARRYVFGVVVAWEPSKGTVESQLLPKGYGFQKYVPMKSRFQDQKQAANDKSTDRGGDLYWVEVTQ